MLKQRSAYRGDDVGRPDGAERGRRFFEMHHGFAGRLDFRHGVDRAGERADRATQHGSRRQRAARKNFKNRAGVPARLSRRFERTGCIAHAVMLQQKDDPAGMALSLARVAMAIRRPCRRWDSPVSLPSYWPGSRASFTSTGSG